MSPETSAGHCLASQQIRDLVKSGQINVANFDENQIQPSSFEPKIGNHAHILDAETKGIFRPKKDETIYRTLIQLPKRQRQQVDISSGFELKKGFTYLIPLEERVRVSDRMHIKSSPKSSLGRLFLNTRLIGDYNNCFDEIRPHRHADFTELWLMVQPLAFNVIVHPKLTLNQLRFFKGYDAQLSATDLMKEDPILFKRADDVLSPCEISQGEGLEIHLNLLGEHTQGVVGLRARHNPTPIDLRLKNVYSAEEFFEPINSKNVTAKRGEYYLFSSSEVLKIPKHLNAELRDHSHLGFHGPLHFAGFIDNGFTGDLVFEVRLDELFDMELEDKMPLSKLDVFRTELPDKLYGAAIGSNYNCQVGCRPPKYFKSFDFSLAARNYKKLDRMVLVQDARFLHKLRTHSEGFQPLVKDTEQSLLEIINNGFFQSRYDCEDDSLVLQLIPYALIFGDKTVFSYVRANNIRDYGDERLFGKHSIGIGGHVSQNDDTDVQKALEREIKEEIKGSISKPKLVGTMFATDVPVDRVHYGLVFVAKADGDVELAESSIISGKLVKLQDLTKDDLYHKKYETWSRLLIPYLSHLYEQV